MTIARRHALGVLTTTGVSLLSLPVCVLLLMYGSLGLTSHSIPASNEIWGCSQYSENCVGPQYYQTVIAAAVLIAFLIMLGWLGQRMARFSRPKLAIALLSVYSGFMIMLGLVSGFVVFGR